MRLHFVEKLLFFSDEWLIVVYPKEVSFLWQKVSNVQSNVSGIYTGIYSTCLFCSHVQELLKESSLFPIRHYNAYDIAFCKQQCYRKEYSVQTHLFTQWRWPVTGEYLVLDFWKNRYIWKWWMNDYRFGEYMYNLGHVNFFSFSKKLLCSHTAKTSVNNSEFSRKCKHDCFFRHL